MTAAPPRASTCSAIFRAGSPCSCGSLTNTTPRVCPSQGETAASMETGRYQKPPARCSERLFKKSASAEKETPRRHSDSRFRSSSPRPYFGTGNGKSPCADKSRSVSRASRSQAAS